MLARHEQIAALETNVKPGFVPRRPKISRPFPYGLSGRQDQSHAMTIIAYMLVAGTVNLARPPLSRKLKFTGSFASAE